MCATAANSIHLVISVEKHLNRILTETGRIENESVSLEDAQGRCLAEPVVARRPVPPWTNSAMDGYAVRGTDLSGASAESPVTLRVVADVPAGSSQDPAIETGEACRIMTGAALPSAADTVVPQELTDGGLEAVTVVRSVPVGRHVRRAGEDREAGSPVASAGVQLSAESLAAIASAGVGSVTVSRRPRLAVVSTGDELVPPGESLERGQIPDSNGLLVSLLGQEAGAITSVDHTGDDPEELESVIERHRESSDLIVITGGVSVGAFDPVKALFKSGSSVRFDRVAMQPGKPQAFGRLGEDGPLVFGLPGNPVSAWVSFQMFVRPALRKLQGYECLNPEPVSGIAVEDWKTPEGRMQVIPVRIRDGEERQVRPAAGGGSGSHLIASLADADGYALVEAEVEAIETGDRVLTVRTRDPEQFNQRSSQ